MSEEHFREGAVKWTWYAQTPQGLGTCRYEPPTMTRFTRAVVRVVAITAVLDSGVGSTVSEGESVRALRIGGKEFTAVPFA